MDDLAAGRTSETFRDASPLGSTLSGLPLGIFSQSSEPRGNIDSGPLFAAKRLKCAEPPPGRGHSGKLFKITTAGSRHQKFTHPNLNPSRRLAKLRPGKLAEKEKLDRTHRKALSRRPFPPVRLHPSMRGWQTVATFIPVWGWAGGLWRCNPCVTPKPAAASSGIFILLFSTVGAVLLPLHRTRHWFSRPQSSSAAHGQHKARSPGVSNEACPPLDVR